MYHYAVTRGRKRLDLDVLEAVERRRKELETMHEKKKTKRRNLWRRGFRDTTSEDDGAGGGVSGDDDGKSRWFWRSS